MSQLISNHNGVNGYGDGEDYSLQSEEELLNSDDEEVYEDEDEAVDEDEDEDEEEEDDGEDCVSTRQELLVNLRYTERELRVKSNALDEFVLDMTRRLSQLNAQLHLDAEESRHKDQELELLQEKNNSLSDLLQRKEEAYDLLSTEQVNDQSYLMETLIKYEFLINSFSEVKVKETTHLQIIEDLKGKLVSQREISAQLQQDKDSMRSKLTSKEKQLARSTRKLSEVQTILDSAASELETVREERDSLLSLRGETAESVQHLIEMERQETLSWQHQNDHLKQELENAKKILEKQKSNAANAERELLDKSRVVASLEYKLDESVKEERALSSKLLLLEIIELMAKSERASVERLDMVIDELRRSKEMTKSLQSRVSEYESLMLSDQSLNELYLSFSKALLQDPRSDFVELSPRASHYSELYLESADSLDGLKRNIDERQEEIEFWKCEAMKRDEERQWTQVRLELLEKTLYTTRKQLEESSALVLTLEEQRQHERDHICVSGDVPRKHEPLEIAELDRMVTDLQLSCLTHQKRNAVLVAEIQRLEEELTLSNSMKDAAVDRLGKSETVLPSQKRDQALPRSTSTPNFSFFLSTSLPVTHAPTTNSNTNAPMVHSSSPPISILVSPSPPQETPKSPRLTSIIAPLVPTPSFTVTPPSPRLKARDATPMISSLTRSRSTPNFFELFKESFSLNDSLPPASESFPSTTPVASPESPRSGVPSSQAVPIPRTLSSKSAYLYSRTPTKEHQLSSHSTTTSPSPPHNVRPSPPLLLPRQELSASPPSAPAQNKDKFALQLSPTPASTHPRRRSTSGSTDWSPPDSPPKPSAFDKLALVDQSFTIPPPNLSPLLLNTPFILNRTQQLPSSPFVLQRPMHEDFSTPSSSPPATPPSTPPASASPPSSPLLSSPSKLSRTQSLDAIAMSSTADSPTIELLPLQAAKQRIRDLESTITFPKRLLHTSEKR